LAMRMRPAAVSRGPGWQGGRLGGHGPGPGGACCWHWPLAPTPPAQGALLVPTEPAPRQPPGPPPKAAASGLSALDWHSPAVAPYFGPGAAEARPRMEENPRSSGQSAAYFAQAPPPGGSAGQPRPESAALDAPSLRSESIQLDSRVWNLEPKEMAPSLSMSDLRCWDQLLGP
jgi:hypothetical protein